MNKLPNKAFFYFPNFPGNYGLISRESGNANPGISRETGIGKSRVAITNCNVPSTEMTKQLYIQYAIKYWC